MKHNQLFITLLVIGVGIIWGSSGTVTKYLLFSLSPFQLAFLRFSLATLLIFPFFIREQHMHHFQKRLIPLLFLSTLNVFFFVLGITKTTVASAAAIYCMTPIFALVVEHFFLHEHITREKGLGIIFGLTGNLIIIFTPLFKQNHLAIGSFVGNILIFAAALSWAGYTVGSRYLINHKAYTPFYLTFFSFLMSSAFFLLLLLVQKVPVIVPMTTQTIFWVSFLAIFVTVVTYGLYQWLIKHISTNMATLNQYVQVPAGIFFAWLFLGESLTTELFIGTFLIFIGVFLATPKQKSQIISTPE